MCMCDVCVMIEAAWREAACHQNMNVCHYTRDLRVNTNKHMYYILLEGDFTQK